MCVDACARVERFCRVETYKQVMEICRLFFVGVFLSETQSSVFTVLLHVLTSVTRGLRSRFTMHRTRGLIYRVHLSVPHVLQHSPCKCLKEPGQLS